MLAHLRVFVGTFGIVEGERVPSLTPIANVAFGVNSCRNTLKGFGRSVFRLPNINPSATSQ